MVYMVYKNSDMAYLIEEYCHSDRDRKVLRMLLLHNASVEEIAEKLDYSSRQMARIVKSARKDFFDTLNQLS